MRVLTAALICAVGVFTITMAAAQQVDRAPIVTGTVTWMAKTTDLEYNRK
jgi:hypothetical protein